MKSNPKTDSCGTPYLLALLVRSNNWTDNILTILMLVHEYQHHNHNSMNSLVRLSSRNVVGCDAVVSFVSYSCTIAVKD